ncbi:DUF86 domain-containing protein [Methylococcus sp. EFPC2]|uniref:type VII toxin-antitoxin system HepT family RNase toxin n=1 Tax=Methylococcus sp. EFPC2 TaxID=2812648 RepID=UPI0019684B08|nr:DUF86 domain-containing protein [Methylococcus sp. EFPC2]QSA96816.1 DUF86 domain-containing protein [Methylococcus sp. EFPC2]
MRLEIYQAETARVACEQCAMLDEASQKVCTGQMLSALEQNGVLHALQILMENTIGKAKQLLKSAGEPVPLSAYEAFAGLVRRGLIAAEDLPQWNSVIGIRNRIVHDYMNIDLSIIIDLVRTERYRFIGEFLLRSLPNDTVNCLFDRT